MSKNTLLRTIPAVFFLSGALGLVYEILWLRKLMLVFGTTVHATSTVLTAFLGGLALGSWLFGRLIDRRDAASPPRRGTSSAAKTVPLRSSAGLRWYAACEAGIGLYAFITPWLFQAIERVYIPIYRAADFSPAALVGASFVCSLAILLIPTTLMGGTFPLMNRFLIRTADERGETIASLYGWNTAGAMAGTVFAYAVGLQVFGWLATIQCAGLLNLLIAVMARAIDRNLRLSGFHAGSPPAESVQPPDGGQDRRRMRALLAAFAVSGFSAMAYEICWTRSLTLVVGSSVYAFCIMLATFLGGIAWGSFAARRSLQRRPASLDHIVAFEVWLAVLGLCSIPSFAWLPRVLAALWPLTGESFAGLIGLQVLFSVLVMALPTFLMGLIFPFVGDLVTGRLAHLGRRLGSAYAINTIGGIVGSFVCGFWLIPSIGIAWALAIAALGNLAAGLWIYLRCGAGSLLRRAALTSAVFICYVAMAATAFVPSWRRQIMVSGLYLNPSAYAASLDRLEQDNDLLFYRESLNTTVSVHRHRQDGNIYLKVGGKTDASLGVDMGTQVLAAHIPLLLHPHPSRVLVIGLGSGITLGSVGRYPVPHIDCAEIDPAVVEGARYFGKHNYHVHDDPRVRLHVADGRNFLLATTDRYDAIISEPSNPWMSGIGYLFTEEFYRLANARLAPDGLMCQWFHLYRMFPSDVKLILRTFQTVFPYTTVWSTTPGDIVLVGSQLPYRLDDQRLRERLGVPAIRQDLDRVSMADPRVFTEFFLLGPSEVGRVTANVGWIHHDDQPWLEFNAPKALYVTSTFDVNFDGLERFHGDPAVISNVPRGPRDASFYRALGDAYRSRREMKKAAGAYAQALALDPNDSRTAMRLGEVYKERGDIHRAHEALDRALALDPANAEAYYLLARLFHRQDDLSETLAAYARAASLKAPDRDHAEEIGLAYRTAKRWTEAAEFFRSAIAQGPEPEPKLLAAFADSLREAGQWDAAEQALTTAVARHPEAAGLQLRLAQALRHQGRRREASAWFQRVVKQAPATADAYIGLGEIAFEERDLRQAARWLNAGLRYDPYNVNALNLLQIIHGR